jgi:hypothetical protein
LTKQLTAYRNYPIYLFDGPHYVSNDLIRELTAKTAKPAP